MTATAHMRGHAIIYKNNAWVYKDTLKQADDSRACIRCDKMPYKNGHDACLGQIKNINNACCGHGVTEGYVI